MKNPHTPETRHVLPDWLPKRLMNESEVAPILGVEVATLQYWRSAKTRDLPFIKVGRLVKYDPSALWAWLQRNTKRPTDLAY